MNKESILLISDNFDIYIYKVGFNITSFYNLMGWYSDCISVRDLMFIVVHIDNIDDILDEF